jgi:hypothetical protein
MDDFDMDIAKTVAMGETISNLAHASKNLPDEDMQQLVKVAAHICLQMMRPPAKATNIVGLDGGKMQ